MLLGKTESISHEVEDIISDFSNTLCVSSASIIETILLHKTHKIRLGFKVEELTNVIEDQLYLNILHTKDEHLKTYSQLEIIPNHKDQIDHFIISQAISEKMILVSSDRKFKEYSTQKLEFVFNKR